MTTYTLSGLHCEKCVTRIKNALADKLTSFSVTLNPPQLVTPGDTPDLVGINTHLKTAGNYSASLEAAVPAATDTWLQTYRPVLLIVGYAALIGALVGDTAYDAMRIFMAGYFLAFSYFKFLNVDGFAMTYARYNLLAMRWPAYGRVYPFIELALGLGYAINAAPMVLNWITLILSVFAGIGVARAVQQKKVLRCACLGSTLALPVGTVTLIEDFGMAAMAALMLLGLHG